MTEPFPSTSSPSPHVIVGVGAGIAAYKTADLVSKLVQSGSSVRVVMTPASEQFIGAATFAALSGHPVVSHSFAPANWPLGPHIEIAENAGCFCIAPATADILGKLAHGIADNLLTTMYLQASCPVLIAPAMSHQMWDKPAVQRNLDQLIAEGVHVIGPDEGWLSCRKRGAGRMSAPSAILERILQLVASA